MLVERENELKTLFEMQEATNERRGQIALISGEAGIGKSALLSAFRDGVSARAPNTNWYTGGCEALFTPRTLGPIYDMAPDLGEEVEAALGAEAGQSALYAAILSALDTAEPSIMVCEDLHWADYATLDLIKYIARRISLLPVMLIITFRDDEMNLSNPLTQLLGDLPGGRTHRIPLSPLSEDAVCRLSEEKGYDGQHLYAITNGNPFYLTELLAAQSDGDFVPASVKDAVALRLSQLEPAERELLERISVLPSAPNYAFLEELLGQDALEQIAACVAKGLLIEDGVSVRFRHELARLATFDRITPARRRTYHAECLKILINPARRSPLDQIVHHASGAYDSKTVLTYAPQAAKAAAQAGSHREAAAHFGSAIRFVDDAEPELAAELYENWAYESTLADRIDEEVIEARRHALTLWRALGRQDRVGENLRHLSRLHWYRGESSEAARYADQAIHVLEALPISPERAMAYSMRAQYHMLNDHMDEAVRWGKKALEFEKQSPEPEIRMHALNNIGTAMVFRGKREGLDYLNGSLALALMHGHDEHAARAYNNMAEFAVEFRDFDLAERILSDGLAFDTEHDLDAWTHYLSGRQAQLRMDQGRLDDAVCIAEGVVSLKTPSFISRLPAELVLSRAYMRRGDEGAEQKMLEALSDAIATDELQHIVPARLTLIEWAWLTNAPGRAGEHMQRLLELSDQDRHPWNIGARTVWADRLGAPMDNLSRDHLPEPCLQELDGDYETAAGSWDALGLSYEGALVRLRMEDNADALQKAFDAFDHMNARQAMARVRLLAERAGFSLVQESSKRGPYKAARSHPLGLTGKEQHVLRLLGEGLSNREIADELNRSQRTIEHHVSSILGKMNAQNRMAAILRLQREPWLIEG